jgi:hypothetical protein
MTKRKIMEPTVHLFTIATDEKEQQPVAAAVEDEDDAKPEHYCPYCGRTLVAANIKELVEGIDAGYVFVHDEVDHPDSSFLSVITHH